MTLRRCYSTTQRRGAWLHVTHAARTHKMVRRCLYDSIAWESQQKTLQTFPKSQRRHITDTSTDARARYTQVYRHSSSQVSKTLSKRFLRFCSIRRYSLNMCFHCIRSFTFMFCLFHRIFVLSFMLSLHRLCGFLFFVCLPSDLRRSRHQMFTSSGNQKVFYDMQPKS